MSRFLLPAFAAAMLLAPIAAPAAPRPPKTNPQWYSRQDTWQETLRLSREALVRRLARAFPDRLYIELQRHPGEDGQPEAERLTDGGIETSLINISYISRRARSL